ncbi:MAG: glycosyltransferase [Myxococcota bacterium]
MRHDAHPVRIVSSEPLSHPNPYVRLFYGALEHEGFDWVGTFVPSRRWLRAHAGEFDALHVHWIEWMMRSEPDCFRRLVSMRGGWRIVRLMRPLFPWLQLHALGRFCAEARVRRKPIVWTCHNVEPHEGASWPVRAAFRRIARSVDLVICHDESARRGCWTRYRPTGRIVVMPHGNYDGVYPKGRPRDEVRRALGLPLDRPLVLCVGQVRPYKGVDLVCEAVARLSGRVALLVAGDSHVHAYTRRIEDLVRSLPDAVFANRHLSDQEFADFVGASDVVALAYRGLTGSGSALAVLTLGRGVVASDWPFFRDLLRGRPRAGRVFAPGDARALAAAIDDLLGVDPGEREKAARALAAGLSWSTVVAPVAEKLRTLMAEA